MRQNVEYSLKKLQNAFFRLQEAVSVSADDLSRDGVIQRFEFVFELFWKAVKIVLQYEGFDCQGPRSCIKEASRRDFLINPEMLLDMLDDRNRASHVYDETIAMEIYDRIKRHYVGLIKINIETLKNYLHRLDN